MTAIAQLTESFDLSSCARLAQKVLQKNPKYSKLLADIANVAFAGSGQIESLVEKKTGLKGDKLASLKAAISKSLVDAFQVSLLLPDNVKSNQSFMAALPNIAECVLDMHIHDGEFPGSGHRARQDVAALAQIEMAKQLGLIQPENP